MTGALNLSLRPLSSAMQSMAVKREGFISRYFCQNNGVGDQYNLLKPIVLSGDFEVELSVYIDATGTFHQLLSGTGFTFNVKADDATILFKNGYINKSFSQKVIRGKFNTIIIKRLGGLLICVVNGVSESSNQPVTNFNIQVIAGWYDYGTPSPLKGIVAGLKIWQGGDRNSDNSVLTDWYKFDDQDSIYQRNHAVVPESELISIGNEWVIPGVYTGELTYTDNSISVINVDNELGTRASKVFDNLVIGQAYLVKTTHTGVDTYNVYAREGDIPGAGSIVYSSATQSTGNYLEFVFTATQTSMNILYSRGGSAGDIYADNISIKEFHGCEIVGGMPEDWFLAERQPHWDYWLKPNFWDAANVITTGACTAVGNSIEFSMTNTTLAGARLPGIEDVHVYQISGYSDVSGVINPTQSTGFADNIAVALERRFVYDSTGVGLTLGIKRQQGEIVTGQVRDITVREKLEIAQ